VAKFVEAAQAARTTSRTREVHWTSPGQRSEADARVYQSHYAGTHCAPRAVADSLPNMPEETTEEKRARVWDFFKQGVEFIN
jgi:hypothetical protein